MNGSPSSLLERRLVMFTGKGGVGKSTLVAAGALAAARAGRRPLVVELGHRASMEGIFDCGPIGYTPKSVGHGIHAMNLDFQEGLREYMEQHIRVGRAVRAIMRNNALQRFFNAAPSVSEVATLNKLSTLEAEREGGARRWDPILVDLDATGHALMLLNLPRVLDGLIGDGPMRGLVDGFSTLLADASRTVLNLVTLPAELPAQETCELYEKLRGGYDVPLGTLFVNQVPPEALDPKLDALADAAHESASKANDTALLDDLAVLERARNAHDRSRAQIERMRGSVDLPLVTIGRRSHEGFGIDDLAAIGQIAFEGAGA